MLAELLLLGCCCVALLYISSFIVQNKFHTEVQRRKAKIVTTFRCEKKLS